MKASSVSPLAEDAAGEPTRPSRIVLADDHAIVRNGIRALLARAGTPGYDVVAEVADGPGTVAAVKRLRPDVLILDVSMPPHSGVEILEDCLAARRDLAVVVFTMHAELAFARQALAAGARAYVLKDASAGELLAALRLAQRGSTYLPPGMARLLVVQTEPTAAEILNSREREVIRLIALGNAYPEIARSLGVSERTVKNYRGRAAEKLGLCRKQELIRWALEHGLVGVSQIRPLPAAATAGPSRRARARTQSSRSLAAASSLLVEECG